MKQPLLRAIPVALVLAAAAMGASAQAANAPAVPATTVTSPDGRLQIQFATTSGGPAGTAGWLVYSVRFNRQPLINNSSISLTLQGQPPLGPDVRLLQATPGSGVDDYTPVAGKAAHVDDPYNRLALTFTEPQAPGRTLAIEARAYNSGIAFRYIVPRQSGLDGYQLQQEDIGYSIAKDANAWALELPNFLSPYESEYIPLHVSALTSQSHVLIGLPTLMQVPGVGWMAILEAGLEGDAKAYLTVPAHGCRFCLRSEISPRKDGTGPAVTGALPHASAWHVILVGNEPGRLLESNLIDDLNPPNVIGDTSWIHAGKASWNWWSGDAGPNDTPDTASAARGDFPMTTATIKYYIDFAAQSGLRYTLIDAGWSKQNDILEPIPQVDVPALVQYANTKGVKIWLWIHHNAAVKQMDAAFPLYEKWGVAGVKVDFIQEDDQPGVAFYYQVAKLAAAHHLMVDFHGATPPWGLERTYPNVLGYEAVLGMEYNKPGARDTPLHRVRLAFTRMLAGPMDYTPGGFRNVTQAAFTPRNRFPMVQGTRAQQLALYVIDFVPIQMVSDAPSAYAHQPAFQFIKDVPAAWDETRVLDGFPDNDITIARRRGRDWYLGSITDWDARDERIPLSFLGGGKYTAEIYEDASDAAENPEHVTIRHQTVSASGTLTVHLAPGGGCAIHFVRR